MKSDALLESAVRKVVETAGGVDAYPTLFTKVAAGGYSIVQNHVFNDANKRTALQAMLLTLRLNGTACAPSTLAVTTVMLLLATGHLKIDGLRVALIHWCSLDPADDTL